MANTRPSFSSLYEIKLGKHAKRSLARRNTMLVDPAHHPGSDSGADDSSEQNAPTNDARATEPTETQPT